MADALRGNPLRGTHGSQSAEIAQGNAEIAQGKKAREGSRRVETGGAALELNALPQQLSCGLQLQSALKGSCF